MSAIQTNDVTYQSGAFQLRSITASFPVNQITAIIGPNGSGKSTLLKTMLRLLQADDGEICVYSKAASSYSTNEWARTITMLTQSKSELPDMTVRELIRCGRSPYKRMFDRLSRDDEEIIEWAMEVTGTKQLEQRFFHTLSGGEQQKARIAMALAQKTGILVLDEPTTYLDIAHQLELMELLRYINTEYRITVVMVLHELQQAAAYCHYLIAMKQGRIAASGAPRDIITTQFLQHIYGIDASVRFEQDYPVIIPHKISRRYHQ